MLNRINTVCSSVFSAELNFRAGQRAGTLSGCYFTVLFYVETVSTLRHDNSNNSVLPNNIQKLFNRSSSIGKYIIHDQQLWAAIMLANRNLA